MEELVDTLISERTLKTPRIIDAFYAIDRKLFVPREEYPFAYADYPLPIGFGQTISQPTTVAFMLEMLAPEEGQHVLDVGSGSGWTTALLSHIVGNRGKVVSVERIPELLREAEKRIPPSTFPNVHFMHASKELGAPSEAPFDRILVSAEAPSLKETLVRQLYEGGALVIPVKNSIWHVEKKKGEGVVKSKCQGFAFVPLIEEEHAC